MKIENFWAIYLRHYSDVFIHSVYATLEAAQEARKNMLGYDSIHEVYGFMIEDRVLVLGKASDMFQLRS